MTQITTALYQQLAEDYSDVYDQLQLVSASAVLAVNHIVDVTSGGYGAGAAAAVEIELALLQPFNTAQVGLAASTTTSATLLAAVRALNGHVINNTTGSTTAKAKLDTWVNTTMGTLWHSGVPNGWQEISQDAGYNTDDWNINPSIVSHTH